MASRLPTRRIRQSTPSELRDWYKVLFERTTIADGTQRILDAIEHGSIPPKSFATWLGVAKSPYVVKKGLQQNFSVIVRVASIKQLGKSLSSNDWKHMWNLLGDTQGLLDLFSNLSVNEVRQACKLLGRCARVNYVLEKRECITELFMGLQPHIFTDAPFRTKDRRRLGRFYRYLIASCTEDLVERIVIGDLKGVWKPIKEKDLMRFHPDIARKEQLRTLQPDSETTVTLERLKGLIGQYPTSGTTTRSFTPSMDFALQVLRRIVIDGSSRLDEEVFINDLVRPLLNRCIKKKVPWPITKEVVDLLMRYLEKHPYVGIDTMMRGDVRHLVALCWTRKPELFAESLRTLCSHPTFGTNSSTEPYMWGEFLDGISMRHRYALFRLCFEASTGLDVDNDELLGSMKGQIDNQLLGKFTTWEALSLFKRLRAARGDDNLVMVRDRYTILNTTPKYKRPAQDLDIVLVHLLFRNGDWEEARKVATQRVTERKKEAEKGSEPEQRAFYAKSAIYYAAASGDLQLLHEVVDWTKRFMRDTLVFRELYPSKFPREIYTLLTGMPDNTKGLTLGALRARVQAANNLIRSMFETACSAIREPSFQAGDWRGVLDLFRRVVENRMKMCAKVKKDLKASDDDIFSTLWASTIDMLLAVEARANRPENRRLGANSVRGPMDCTWESSADLRSTEPSVYRFLDELAKGRDEFWKTLRPKYQPAVLALPEPYPRGLPIQHLIAPWVLDEPHLEKVTPYIASRVRAIIFPIPEDVQQPVPDDEESVAAIGGFVDSYEHALRLYVSKSGSRKYREHHLKQAWDFAIESMTCGRMNDEEAIRFWESKGPYKNAFALASKPSFKEPSWPQIPEVEQPWPVQLLEWNPFTSGRPDQPSRTLDDLTYLDLSLIIHDHRTNIEKTWSALSNLSPFTIPGNCAETRSIWDSDRSMGEGGVLSALMYLEMKYGAPEGSLLSTHFPSTQDQRYPAMYLDPEFHGDPLNPYTAVRSIQGHIDNFPPAVLHLAAKNMMANLAAVDSGEEEDDSIQELALNLILRLAESDRPALAVDMVVKTIFERPGASSWHRKLLKPKLLRRLAAKDAEMCFNRFSEAVLERLGTKEEKNDRDGDKLVESGWMDVAHDNDAGEPMDVDSPSSAKPFVKITTIKFLAQLLRDIEIVDSSSTLSILSTLLEKATHTDVRLNTIKSLLHMLDNSSPEQVEGVLVALETVIPQAGNFYELKPVREEAWIKAEEAGILPSFPDIDDLNPTMKFFVEHFRSSTEPTARQQIFLQRILLPTLTYHQSQISRWARLFLLQQHIDSKDVEIPRYPIYMTQLLRHSVSSGSSIPSTTLTDLVSYIIFCISPPPAIKVLNSKLRADHKELEKKNVQTWFQLFGFSLDAIAQFRRFDMLALLDNKGISPDIVCQEYMRAFKAIITVDVPRYRRLTNSFLPDLLAGKYVTRKWWNTHGKAVVRDMIAHIDSLRTEEWAANPVRSPSVLPDTFPWRLLRLDFPHRTPSNTQINDPACAIFATQLGDMSDEISTGVYHGKLDAIKTFLDRDPVSTPRSSRRHVKRIGNRTHSVTKPDVLHNVLQSHRMRIAVYLSSLPNTGEVAAMLRVDIVRHLLGLVEDEWKQIRDEEGKRDVRRMVQGLKGDRREEVRRCGEGLVWVDK